MQNLKNQQSEQMKNHGITRRQILKSGMLLTLTCLYPHSIMAQNLFMNKPDRSLSLLNTHTGEHLKHVVYWEKGRYLPDALDSINYVLRDHRTDEIHEIDPMTLDLMTAISQKFATSRPFEIISGYRSPHTNAMLQKGSNGVAKNSYHMKGMAVDLRLPGVPLKELRKVAINLRMGGVGYYPESNFVHIDSGKLRSW